MRRHKYRGIWIPARVGERHARVGKRLHFEWNTGAGAGIFRRGAIPNLDSIYEFRILTNNPDAEYGNYSGGLINVVTKSGTNGFHGNLFEFVRNTDFDAANYFAHGQRSAYHQNQFGGTFGGPIKRDKIFFFADYQGNRVIQGQTQIINGAPSAATEGGRSFGDRQHLARLQGNWTGMGVAIDHAVGPAGVGGRTLLHAGLHERPQCVFPNAQLSPTAFNPISANLLPYILPANQPIGSNGTGQYLNSSEAIDLTDNKFSGRVDANSGFGLLTAYYYFDKYNQTSPYWPGNAPLYPGFSVAGNGTTRT